MPTEPTAPPTEPGPFLDRFTDDRPRGTVVGSTAPSGVRRTGIDVERVISVDHGALRIRPLLQPGWGRSQITYGPYRRRDGLMMAALVLNGHNTSQAEPLPESLPKRFVQWLQGHGDRRLNLVRRAGQWLRHPRKSYLLPRLRSWYHMARGPVENLDENMAIGWSATEVQRHPNDGGNSFVMHAALGANGELWTRSSGELVPVVRGLQNIPICYVVILRERGAAYYIGSLPDAHGTAALPRLRPVAIDVQADEEELYACIHQAALGQIGFRVDSRVYGVQVAELDALRTWWGTAHAADLLSGEGALDAEPAVVGGSWDVVRGKLQRTADGGSALEEPAVAVLRPAQPTGLLHVLVELPPDGDATAGLVLRWRDRDEHCRVDVTADWTRVLARTGGATSELAAAATPAGHGPRSLQVLDDGRRIVVVLDGARLLDVAHQDAGGRAVGIHADAGARLTRFEAHPREVDLGGELELPDPWHLEGSEVVVADDFAGPAGDLEGRQTSVGRRAWRREYGKGRIETTGDGAARVDATVARPNRGSTAYTVAWDDPTFADIEVEVTPPGTARGQWERGRAGLIVWDDEQNFLTISMYVDDDYDGASIAIFSHLDGFEEIYDAVWSMVGSRITFGVPHRLRVTFDGEHLLTYIDGEPVLYRAVTDIYEGRRPMRVNRVGIAVNWEWGDDTGSVFRGFVVRGRAR